jgi:hypothetical protein
VRELGLGSPPSVRRQQRDPGSEVAEFVAGQSNRSGVPVEVLRNAQGALGHEVTLKGFIVARL